MIIKRHPYTARIELNTASARERDNWIETALHHAKGESFWRERCRQRCERDGHVWIRCEDDSADYCTCCGEMTDA